MWGSEQGQPGCRQRGVCVGLTSHFSVSERVSHVGMRCTNVDTPLAPGSTLNCMRVELRD